MKQCLILMATYNGAKYIKSQIESICNQDYPCWKLIIRDDGSNDRTLNIIRSFINNGYPITLITNDTGMHGAYVNFWSLINYAKTLETYDYYFFADQDDIWAKNKLSLFLKEVEEYDNIPIYAYSDMSTINSSDDIMLESVNKTMGIDMKDDTRTLFYSQGYVWGCASMINVCLFKQVQPMDENIQQAQIISHDNFYAKHALILGRVLFINKSLLLHRRHENNTTGKYSMKLSPFVVIKKGFIEINETAKTHALGYDQTLYTLDWMDKEGIQNKDLKKIKKSITKGGVGGVFQLLRFGVRRPQIVRTLGVYIIMLTKSYKKYLTYRGI